MTLQERFDEKYQIVEPGGCWVWTGAMDKKGYGAFSYKGQNSKAHRVSWEIHHGPIPRGKGYHGTCVCHTCDNRLCVNPAHLFLGTMADNQRDMVEKGRCHSYGKPGEANGYSKLTQLQVKKIRRLGGNVFQREIARRFGVSQTQIQRILSREAWPHV